MLGRRVASLAALAAAGFAWACAPLPAPRPPGPILAQPQAQPQPYPPAQAAPTLVVQGLPLSSLSGWAEEDHRAAFDAFRTTCARTPALIAACASARQAGPLAPDAAKAWLEARFVAQPVQPDTGATGLLTGYFAPEYRARDRPDAEFSAPVRPRPADLVAGQPYRPRAEIEQTPSEALAWMRPEELFFLQIQGSGTLVFPDGRRLRAVYAADNGLPFVGVARVMRAQGLLADNQTSGEAIRGWLAAHRGPEAQAVMNANPRYIFFAVRPDDGREPAGAAGVPLPPGRAVAVDPSRHAYGELFWIEAEAPALSGAFPRYRRLVSALDTGGAIKGAVRADLYLGRGAAAGTEAGRIRHQLRMWRLVPRG
ncbi:MAG: MltA domain-containing protein [Proteobacteria bacterium]|nr:MltA domain-containing protein [Pseudomonadota bacterium]